jgi:hypothetical protein
MGFIGVFGAGGVMVVVVVDGVFDCVAISSVFGAGGVVVVVVVSGVFDCVAVSSVSIVCCVFWVLVGWLSGVFFVVGFV